MGWLITLFELIRDRIERWQFNKLKRSFEGLQLTVPLEAQVANAEIRAINAEVNMYNLQEGNEKVKTRVINAKIRGSKAR
jgi:hypothetical protein